MDVNSPSSPLPLSLSHTHDEVHMQAMSLSRDGSKECLGHGAKHIAHGIHGGESKQAQPNKQKWKNKKIDVSKNNYSTSKAFSVRMEIVSLSRDGNCQRPGQGEEHIAHGVYGGESKQAQANK